MALFGFRRTRPEADARRRVEQWAREAWRARPDSGIDDVTVKANEILCPDPACPGLETVILILPPKGRTQAFKLSRPIAEIGRDDVFALFHEAG